MFAISGTGMYVIPGVLHSHPKPKLRAEVFPWPHGHHSKAAVTPVKSIFISIRLIVPNRLKFPPRFLSAFSQFDYFDSIFNVGL